MPRPVPTLETERLLLTLPPPEAAPRLVDFYTRNKEHFAPWDPERAPSFYTVERWRTILATNLREFEEDMSARFVLSDRAEPDGPVVGIANFSAILRGAFQACFLGFSVDAEREGQGLMREGLEAALAFAFGPLDLHRIMANYQPGNARSAGLLSRLGFVPEGYARDYLFLAGAWRDHVLTALTRPG